MRISLKIEGGIAHFPGLARAHVVDTASLAEAEARELDQLVQRALEVPSGSAPARGADLRCYEINVEQGAHTRMVRAFDPLPAELAALVAKLRSLIAAQARR